MSTSASYAAGDRDSVQRGEGRESKVRRIHREDFQVAICCSDIFEFRLEFLDRRHFGIEQVQVKEETTVRDDHTLSSTLRNTAEVRKFDGERFVVGPCYGSHAESRNHAVEESEESAYPASAI